MKYVLELIKQVEKVPEKFLKHFTVTNGLYEIRTQPSESFSKSIKTSC